MSKHILIISQYYYPEQFRINDIAAEWVRRGYKVTVVTGIPNYPQGKFYKGYGWIKKRKEIIEGVTVIRLPIISRGKSSIRMVMNYFSYVISGFLWKCLTKVKADLVFIFEVSPMTQALVGVWYAKRRKIPCYIYVQDLWPENVEIAAGIHNTKILSSIGKMVDYIYKRCAKIFVTSESFAQAIEERKVEKEKVVYWPQYAEDFYTPDEKKSDLVPEDGILNITFTGNVGTAQGLEILPEAAKLLKREQCKVRFNIVGDGRNKENIVARIKSNDVEAYFNLIEWQSAERIPSILAASDAAFLSFANNRLYEMTIPAKLQSYMACGIPIIGAVSGESERIIKEANCGLTSEIGNAEALAEAIKTFNNMSNEEKDSMRERAVVYTQTAFNKKKLMDEMEEYIEDGTKL